MEGDPRPLSRSRTWNGITSSSTLCDSYEIRAINQSIECALHHPLLVDNSPSLGPTTTHLLIQARTPTSSGSTLCDSNEIRASNQSLERAIHQHKQSPNYEALSKVDDRSSLGPTTTNVQIQARTPSNWRSSPWNGGSTLCDSNEIRAIDESLKQAINHLSPNEASSGVDNHPSFGPTKTHLQTPVRTPLIWRSSPRNGGSTLCDSHELRAVAHQLNRALRKQERGSPCLGYLTSPLYACGRRCVEHFKRETGKTPKRVTCGSLVGRPIEQGKGVEKGGKGGVVTRLWRKLKRTLLWRKNHG